jgi:hypothetical protein
MDVFHVQIIRCDRIGYGILSQDVWALNSIAVPNRNSAVISKGRKQTHLRCHQFRIQLGRIVTQLGLGNSFQVLTSLGQIRISFDPTSDDPTLVSNDILEPSRLYALLTGSSPYERTSDS